MRESEPPWIVWVDHWYHGVDFRAWYYSKEEAFHGAWAAEENSDDEYGGAKVIGIEGPDGFINLGEYIAVKPIIDAAEEERVKNFQVEKKSQHLRKITIAGPGGCTYSETWTDEYFDKYYGKRLRMFGPDRVTVEEVQEGGSV